MIDTHAHLYFEEFKEDLKLVLQRARKAGIAAIICPGTNYETSFKAIQLGENISYIYSAIGVHPHEVGDLTDDDMFRMRDLFIHKKVR